MQNLKVKKCLSFNLIERDSLWITQKTFRILAQLSQKIKKRNKCHR